MPPTLMENPRSVMSFPGFTMRIRIRMPHGSQHAAIHFFASHTAYSSEPKTGHKESHSHDYYMLDFFCACRMPHTACRMPCIRIPSLTFWMPHSHFQCREFFSRHLRYQGRIQGWGCTTPFSCPHPNLTHHHKRLH